MKKGVDFLPTMVGLLLIALLLSLKGVILAPDVAQSAQPSSQQQLLREIYQELIEIDTTDPTGDTTKAAEAAAARLRAAGFPAQDIRVLGPHPKKGNLVARLRGTGGRKPR